MLTYELESCESGRYVYVYYPDGDTSDPGRIALYGNGNMEIIHDANVDVKGYYRGHALHNIYIGKKSGTIAWC